MMIIQEWWKKEEMIYQWKWIKILIILIILMYKCQSVLREHKPPDFGYPINNTDCDNDFESRLRDNTNIIARNTISNDQCKFNCNGKFYDGNYSLNGDNVRLYLDM